MVFYELVMTTKNTAPFHQLTHLVKQISLKIVQDKGIVRSIQNHGIRDLPHRFKAKYPDKQGNRYFKKGRFISVYYDASPSTVSAVTSFVKLEDYVLRMNHLKARNNMFDINIAKPSKNPYVCKVLDMEQAKAEAAEKNANMKE